MRRTFVFAAVMISLTWLVQPLRRARAQEIGPPGPIRALVEARSLTALSTRAGGFQAAVTGQTPTPLGLELMLPALIGVPAPFGVDPGMPVRVLFLEPPLHAHPVLACGLRDGQAYLGFLEGELSQVEGWGDVRRYEGEGPWRAVGVAGNTVVLSASPDAAGKVLELVKKGRLTGAPLLPEGDIAIAVAAGALLEEVTRTSGNPFDALRTLFETASQMPPGGAAIPPAQMVMFNAEMDVAEALCRQTESLLLAFSLSAESLDIKLRLRAAPGTPLAGHIASIPPGGLRTLSYLPADCTAAGAAKIGDPSVLAEWYSDMLRKTWEASGMDPGEMEPLVGVMRRSIELCEGEMSLAMTLSPDAAMTIVEAVTVKDPAAMRALFAEMSSAGQAMSAFYETMGMEMTMDVELGAAVDQGREIDAWRLRFRMLPMPGMDPAMAQQMARQQQQAFERMFGGSEMLMHSTFVGNDWVVFFGEDSLEGLKRTASGEAPPLSVPAERISRADMEEAVGFGYVSLGELANWSLSLIAGMVGESEMPVELSGLKFGKGPGIWMVARSSRRAIECDLTIPSEEVSVIVSGVMEAMSQAD